LVKKFSDLTKKKKRLEVAFNMAELMVVRDEEKNLREAYTTDNNYSAKLKEVVATLQSRTDESSQLVQKIDQLKAGHEASIAEINQEEARLDRLHEEYAAVNLKLEDLQASQSQDIQGGVSELEAVLVQRRAELDSLKEQQASLNTAIHQTNIDIRNTDDESKWIRSKTSGMGRFKDAKSRDTWLKEEIKNQNNIINKGAATLAELTEAVGNLAVENQNLQQAITTKTAERQHIVDSQSDERKARETLEREKNNLQKDFASYETTVREGAYNRGKLQQEVELKFREVGQHNTKIRNLLKAKESIDQVLADENENSSLVLGYHGMVIDLFQFDKTKFLTTVNEVAATRLFYHIADNKQTATGIINKCNRLGLRGEFQFMSMDELRVRRLPVYQPVNKTIHLITELQYEEKYDAVMRFVFGSWVVCANTEVAVNISRTRKGFDFITLDGDKIEGKGVMTGGYLNKNNLLNRFLNFRIKADELENLKSELMINENHFAEAQAGIHKIEAQLERIENIVSRNTVKIDSIQADLRVHELAKADLSQREKDLRESLLNKKGDELSAKKRLAELKEESKKEMRSSLSEEDKLALKKLDVEKRALNAKFKQRSADLNTITAKAAEAENSIECDLVPRLEELRGRMENQENAEADHARLDLELGVLKQRGKQCKLILKDLRAREMGEGVQLKKSVLQNEKIEGEMRKLEFQRGEISKELSRYQEKLTKIQNRIEQLNIKVADIGHVIGWEDYQRAGRKKILQSLTSVNKKLKTEDMMNVNQKAVVDYEELVTEQSKMNNIKSVLRDELESTKAALAALEEKKMEEIEYTLKQVQKYFNELFGQVVPKGYGELKLTTLGLENNIESAVGLSLRVSFTSKNQSRLKDLKSLSGGQKAAVSLVFILAIQKCDPTPFYMFDEIDAALDPTIREAIARVIKDQAGNTQFIATTFRSEFVEAGDKFFGVLIRNSVSRVKEVDKEEAINLMQDATINN